MHVYIIRDGTNFYFVNSYFQDDDVQDNNNDSYVETSPAREEWPSRRQVTQEAGWLIQL